MGSGECHTGSVEVIDSILTIITIYKKGSKQFSLLPFLYTWTIV